MADNCNGDDRSKKANNNMSKLSEDLRNATLHKIKLFDSIRGKECTIPFWDAVVITAIDADQKIAYEKQIKEKMQRNELPLGITFHVFHDPVGPKIGNGGSSLDVLSELETIYKQNLSTKRILVLHAGGYSQRLPSGSLLGKIFTALPLGDPIYQMLELKLAMYIDYPQRMPPGMFVTSADTIELYVLDGDWTFMNKGFTAMAHPSPIEIGTTHGVFVLEESSMKTLTEAEENEKLISVRNGRCRKFLHKPTKDLMRSSGAVFTHNNDEYVYSDSAYFMDYETSKLLLDWYKQHGPLDSEIDAYGDFLQALGPEGTIDYCKNVRNVSLVTENLVKTREEIFHILRNCQLNVLMLNKSKFYHIGTTMEYLHHFCEDMVYRYEMASSNVAMVLNQGTEEKIEKDRCLIHCFLEGNNKIGKKSVVEYSWLANGARIGHTSIISQVYIPESLTLPDRVFMHTVCVQVGSSKNNYITVVFGIDDNLKKSCQERRNIDMLKIYGQGLGHALVLFKLPKDPWPASASLLNLWNARLFPSFDSPQDSLNFAVSMMQSLGTDQPLIENTVMKKRLYSMADILKEKDLKGIFKMRQDIRNKILA